MATRLRGHRKQEAPQVIDPRAPGHRGHPQSAVLRMDDAGMIPPKANCLA